MTFKRSLVFIQSQIPVRDNESRVELALELLKSGSQVCIGQSSKLIADILATNKAVVYLDLGYTRYAAELVREIKRCNHIVISTCEEQTAVTDRALYCDYRLDQEALRESAYVYAYNNWAYHSMHSVFKASQLNTNKIKQILNPRFYLAQNADKDLHSFENKYIRSLLGKREYILITTNGSLNNWERKGRSLLKSYQCREHDSAIIRRIANNRLLKAFAHLDYIRDSIELMKSLPEQHFVIRGRSADIKVIRAYFDLNALKNLTVDNSFSVYPWAKNAQLVISNHCTTAIDAFYSGSRSLIYHNPEDKLLQSTSGELSIPIASNFNELYRLTTKMLAPGFVRTHCENHGNPIKTIAKDIRSLIDAYDVSTSPIETTRIYRNYSSEILYKVLTRLNLSYDYSSPLSLKKLLRKRAIQQKIRIKISHTANGNLLVSPY